MAPSDNPRLAINGGPHEVRTVLVPRNIIGVEEEIAALRVLRSGCLSGFLGSAGEGFLGGPEVRAFEEEWADAFRVRHAITVNSWTSGLVSMLGAIGLEPGDEVIVSPWTMCATATAVLHWNAIPVFADIDRSTYCLDALAVEQQITSRTRAILAVDIFGQSADMTALRVLANKHSLWLVSDSAQAPGALQGGALAGTLADIGGFSLNYHKHIHTGEGGVIVTNDDRLAERCRLIRNHAEAVVAPETPDDELVNMVGYNFRLGEIEAAIGRCQLGKLDEQIRRRQEIASVLDQCLRCLPGLTVPHVAPGNSHVYYIYGMQIEPGMLKCDREWLVRALEAEGIRGLSHAYVNVHRLPMYRRRIAFGSSGYPWENGESSSGVEYGEGICPVAEDLQDQTYVGLEMCAYEMSDEQALQVGQAFAKVWSAVT